MKTFNLLEGTAKLTHTKLSITEISDWTLYKDKFLSIVAGMYIFERTHSKIDRGFENVWDIVLTSLIYVPLCIAIGYWLYVEFIKTNWSRSMKVADITTVTQVTDKNPLNITFELKGNYTTINLTFRKSENEHTSFLESLKKVNSRYTLHHERI